MTTRGQIVKELGKRAYPQTPAMLREKIGKTTVQLLCRCLALEGVILERKYGGAFWYAVRPRQWRPYRIEVQAHYGQWITERFFNTEQGGRQLGAYWARRDPDPYRLMCGSRVVCEWNTKEIESWRTAKRILVTIQKHLRPQSSQTQALPPARTSPA